MKAELRDYLLEAEEAMSAAYFVLLNRENKLMLAWDAYAEAALQALKKGLAGYGQAPRSLTLWARLIRSWACKICGARNNLQRDSCGVCNVMRGWP